MKKMKKLASILLAAIMVLAMAVPSMAVDITISSDASGSSYAAYRLLNLTTTAEAVNKGTTGYAYTLNEKYTSILEEVTSKNGQDEIISYIQSLTDGDAIREFADVVYAKIAAPGSGIIPDGTVESGNVITDMEQGYYLIVETNAADDTAYSLVMLNTAGQDGVTVTVKEDKPSLNKQIKHNDSDTWGVVGDNQVGDEVFFRTITTVPKYTEQYDTYTYTIHDTMSTGLTSNVVNGNANNNVVVKVGEDGTVVSSDYITVTANGNDFTVSINVKEAIENGVMNPGNSLYTTYSGILNTDAKICDEGNQDNVAYLEYSNNPYDDEETTTTPEVKVYDWTFEMTATKTDGDGNQIEGAVFVLSEKSGLEPTADDDGVLEETTDLIALIDNEDGTYTVAPKGYVGSTTYTVTAGKITIEGLDDETDYYLYETKAPAGYNKLKTPVQFRIAAEYIDNGSEL